MNTYDDNILSLVSYYREQKELVIEMLKKFDSPITILESVYQRLVADKEIEPIESLPEETKDELWKEAHRFKPKHKRLGYARAKYLMTII